MKEYVDFFCNSCKEAFSCNLGIKGGRADSKKIFFVLNRSDSREPQPSHPKTYKIALLKSQTGKILSEMLEFCNLTIKDIYLTNLFKCLVPKDREPRISEYQNCFQVLEKQISDFNPGRIIIFGHQVYKNMFKETARKNSYHSMIMQTLDFKNIPTLISYHPGWIWSFNTKKRREHYSEIKKFLDK